MAIARVVKDLSSVGLDRLQVEHFQAVRFLAVYWDALGWIALKTGDFARAEQWLRGAWLLGQESEPGERLGIASEKLGKREAAIEAYAQALAVDSKRTSSRIALERLVGAGRVDVHVMNAQKAIVEQRTIKLPPLVSGNARVDVNLIVDPVGRVTSIRFEKGDERLRARVSGLSGLQAPAVMPKEPAIQLVRQGMIGCGATTGCVLVLLRPADVTPPSIPR